MSTIHRGRLQTCSDFYFYGDCVEYGKGVQMTKAERLAELERELAQLKSQLPKHGLKPSTLARIDELEEEIEKLKAELASEE